MMRAQWLGLLLLGTGGCFGGVDECDRGAARCNGGNPETCQDYCSDLGCHNKWETQNFCTDTQSCIAPSDAQPLCVESPAKDEHCAGIEDATYCNGMQLVQCKHGYRAITRVCGTVDEFATEQLPGGKAATVCVDPGDGTATCIPETAKVDSLCDGVTGPRCAGTTLVECVDQYAVFKTVCATCDVQTPTCDNCTPVPRGVCRGYLGDGCAVDANCAAGLVCHDSGNGQRACSLACTVEVPGASDAGSASGAAPNAQCDAAFAAGGPPISSYSEVRPDGHLSCIAGYCKWAP